MRLALLGGSTPFVVPLFAELAAGVEPGQLVLHGRDERALEAVRAHAAHVLRDWRVLATTDLEAALTGADLVVHQIRYGDLQGRAADEQIAAELGAPADETLGPGALQAALRAVPGLRHVIQQIERACPTALVVNLTNPLSVTTALFAAAGLRVIGLCELPEATVGTAAEVVGAPLDWAYSGLNHRGFLHHLTIAGQPSSGGEVIERLRERLVDRAALGVLGAEVADLDALPLKYFGLFADHAPHGAGRAQALIRLRAAAVDELVDEPTAAPPSIQQRSMPWWALTVGPVVGAICTGRPLDTMLNLPESDGIVRERRVLLTGQRWDIQPAPPAPDAVTPWLERFERHERAVLDCLADPSLDRVRDACAADPALPTAAVDRAARLLYDGVSAS